MIKRTLKSILLLVAFSWLFICVFVITYASTAYSQEIKSAAEQQIEMRRSKPQTTVKEVSKGVMCPTCDTTLDRSDSPSAKKMRTWITKAVAAGWTNDEIRDGLVAEYGGDESVLAVPRNRGVGRLSWIVPATIIVIAFSSGVIITLRWRKQGETKK